jgi:P-type Cu2+ transporter
MTHGGIMCCGGIEAWRAPSGAADANSENDLEIYDDPAVQATFARARGDEREAVLQIEGIRCAACAATNERVLESLPGIVSAQVNYATHQATVRWNPERLRLSEILGAVRKAGYSAAPFDGAWLREGEERERRTALWRLFVACFGMMQVMMYAIPVYLATEGEITADIETLMRWASFVLTVPVVFYSAAPFFTGALRDMRAGRLGMDVPVALGVALAFAASLAATVAGAGEVYYDSVTMFVFLLLLGRYLELLARRRAAEALRHLYRLVPEFAHRLVDFPASTETRRVTSASVKPGDHVLVKPGETVPADGQVVQGRGAVSEAMLSGEPRPVAKTEGSELTGGSMNLESPLVMRVDRVGADTTLSSILRLIERGASEKPRLVQMADRVAGYFIFVVLALALLAGVAWSAADPARAVLVVVAVLVATCPCALSLAMPAALTVATGAMARRGLVIARGHAIETLAEVTDVVFDKTGTLTLGEPRLLEVNVAPGTSEGWALSVARAMEAGSEHPFARAICSGMPVPGADQAISDNLSDAAAAIKTAIELSTEQSIERALSETGQSGQALSIGNLRNVPGAGLEAWLDGRRLRLGSAAFVLEEGLELGDLTKPSSPAKTSSSGNSVVYLADQAGVLASFTFADAPREEAFEAVSALQRAGLAVHLLSGDGRGPGEALAARLGILAPAFGATPERKLEYVRALQANGRKVLMVGDGINDTPAIAAADISVAMGGGTRLAQTRADAVLIKSDLIALYSGMLTARRTLRVIRQNVVWAFAYNLLALPLAVMGMLTPWAAALGMSASSLIVVLNALRLQTPVAQPRERAQADERGKLNVPARAARAGA